MISIRTCYRSVSSHPFLVGMLCLLLFLYKSFPFAFSLLVSASPVLFCTALLLGTLLSYGQPNIIPEIEKDDQFGHAHHVGSLKSGVSEDATVVVDERDESFVIERHAGRGRDIVEEAVEGSTSAEDRGCEVGVDEGLADYVPPIDHSSREIQFEKRAIEESEEEFHGLELEKKKEINQENLVIEGVSDDGEHLENQYRVVHKVGDESLNQVEGIVNPPGQLVDAHKGDHLDFSPYADNDDDDGDDGSFDSGSDLAESSSPDASMADIIPMLDELHPLLDSEAPQPAHMSHDESDVASAQSHKSNDGSVDSDEESEIQGDEVEDGVDENEDDEEEGAQGGKEDESKSAIKWTEDDQKNLMDLGTSELERNQRLENLIARRRARKNMRLMTEKNLIDLDGADLPFNVPPISTARRNPFDLPCDSYEPPGSAPSILLPRRNPFDLPYDPNEEKPDLKGDSFQQEFVTFHQKDAFFRRHESFSLGPTGLGGSRQETHDIKFRPFFVPERFASVGTSYSSFERQSSEVSESKLSSVPDTESVSSAADQDYKKLNEQDFCQETGFISNIDHASDSVQHGSRFSEDIDSLQMEPVERRDVRHDEFEITLGQVGNHSRRDSSLSETGGAATLEINTNEIHIEPQPVEEEYSSRSSLSSLSEIDEKISCAKKEESMSLDIEESGSSMQRSLEEPDFHFPIGEADENPHEPVYDSSPTAGEKILRFSSISSDLQTEISEMGSPPVSIETVHIADKEFELHSESIRKDSYNDEEMHAASSVAHPEDELEPRSREVQESGKDDVTQVKSSGVNHSDQNECAMPEAVVEYVSVESRSSSPDTGSAEEGIANKKESLSHEQDQVSCLSIDRGILFGVHQDVDEKLDSIASSYQTASEGLYLSRKEEEHPQPSIVVEHVSVISSEIQPVELHARVMEENFNLEQDQVFSSTSLDTGSVGEGLMHKLVIQPEQDQVQSSSSDDAEIHVGGHQDADENLDLVASSPQHIPSSDLSVSASEEEHPPLVTEQVIRVLPSHSTSETEHVEVYSLNREEIFQFKQDKVHSLGSDAKIYSGLHQDLDVKVVSFNDHDECREACSTLAEPTDVVRITKHGDVPEVLDHKCKILPNPPSLASDSTQAEIPECKSPTDGVDLQADIPGGIVNEDHLEVFEDVSYSAEAYDSLVAKQNINEEAEEIKEIDEGLLSELDAVGDFSVKEVVGGAEEINVGSSEFELLHKDSKPTKNEPDLPVLEARSLEDIDLAFKKLHEGVDVEEVILPNMVDDWLVVGESNSNMKAVDAKSLDDIDIALNQVSEVNLHELPEPLDSKDQSSSVEPCEVSSAKKIEPSDAGSVV